MNEAKKLIPGWTFREHRPHCPRHELAPEQFYSECRPAEPVSAAWGEADYLDPDAPFARLPVGTRFWQGFAKPSAPTFLGAREERPLSPDWVARTTANVPCMEKPWRDGEEADSLWARRARLTERERFLQCPREIWPG